MRTIEVSEATYRAIEFAARMSGMTPGAVVEKLVDQSSHSPVGSAPSAPAVPDGIPVHGDYNGVRVKGIFDPATTSITITTGPLAGSRYKTPSAAASAVVKSERPELNGNRNGWDFWVLDDGSGRRLREIR